LKKQPVKLTTGNSARLKTKKGNSTQKAQKKRSTPRFYEVKIRINAEEFARGQSYFKEQKYLSRYVLDAYLEKVNRAEAYDKAARLRTLVGNMELLEPVLKEMFVQGRLNFLNGPAQEPANG
jgi:hypothetical protein